MIRVRFAPSPTGYLHIGGVRTALFNYLYARNQEGAFLLRIEDTDRERSKPEYEKEIIGSLEWLGLKWDEAIVRQSERLDRYKVAAEELIQRGLAVKDTDQGRTAIKLKLSAWREECLKINPDKNPAQVIFTDLVHGSLSFDSTLFDDLVLIKSDGYPTYHWACVLDDHDMQITHVIRGDDHLSNTPRQILLYQAMGWKPPKYGHLPLIMGDDGTPLSKRHGAVALSAFMREGFLPEAVLNYLALLGWGVSDNQELFSLQELIKKFSIKRVNKANARFNLEKLEWMNAQHLKKIPEADYLRRVSDFYPELSKKYSEETWKMLLLLFRSRIKTLGDLKTQAAYCLQDIENYDPENAKVFLENRSLNRYLEAWVEKAQELPQFKNHQDIENLTREVAQVWSVEAKDLIHPLRFAVSGRTVTPGLFELMSVLGKETCIARVKKFIGMRNSIPKS